MTCALFAALVLIADAAPNGEGTRTDLYGDPLPPGAVARLGTIRLRHADADVVFSKDGKQLISCGRDGEVRTWKVATGELVRRIHLDCKVQEASFKETALSSDGAMAALASDKQTVYLYETATGKECGRFSIHSYNCDPFLTFSPNGKTLAVQEGSSQELWYITRLWDVAESKKRQEVSDPGKSRLTEIAFTPDGKRLAGVTVLGTLLVWDATTGKVLGKKEMPANLYDLPLTFSSDGKSLAFGSYPKLRLLDVTTLKDKTSFPIPADVKAGSIYQLAFSRDGTTLAASYSELPGQAEQRRRSPVEHHRSEETASVAG